LIASAALVVALAALGVSWYGIRRANRTTSAATLVTLNEGFRQAWERFLAEDVQDREYELAELMNLLEIACAAHAEGSITGNSHKLLFDYLDRVLRALIHNSYANEQIGLLLQSKDTYRFIRGFLKTETRNISVTVPPRWYELGE
jgi:hypothetical protein